MKNISKDSSINNFFTEEDLSEEVKADVIKKIIAY